MSSFNQRSNYGKQNCRNRNDGYHRGKNDHHQYPKDSRDIYWRQDGSSGRLRYSKGKEVAPYHDDDHNRDAISRSDGYKTRRDGGGDEGAHEKHHVAEEKRSSHRVIDLRSNLRPPTARGDFSRHHEGPSVRHPSRADVLIPPRDRDPQKRLARDQETVEGGSSTKAARYEVQPSRHTKIVTNLDDGGKSSSSDELCWKRRRPQKDDDVISQKVEGHQVPAIFEESNTLPNFGILQSPFRMEEYPYVGDMGEFFQEDIFCSFDGAAGVGISPKEPSNLLGASEDSAKGRDHLSFCAQKNEDAGVSSSELPTDGIIKATEDSISPVKKCPFTGKGECSHPKALPPVSTTSTYVPDLEEENLDRAILNVLWNQMIRWMSNTSLKDLYGRKNAIEALLKRMNDNALDIASPVERQIRGFLHNIEEFMTSEGDVSPCLAQGDSEKPMEESSELLRGAHKHKEELSQSANISQGKVGELAAQEAELLRRIEDLQQQLENLRYLKTEEEAILSRTKDKLEELGQTISFLQGEEEEHQRGLTKKKRLAEMEEALEKTRKEIISFEFRP